MVAEPRSLRKGIFTQEALAEEATVWNMEAERMHVDAQRVFERVWKVASAQGISTYAELARRMHTTSATISRLATGKQGWTSKRLIEAANALGVSRRWLEADESEAVADRVCEGSAEYAARPRIEGLAALDIVMRGQLERIYVDPAQLRVLLRQAERSPG